jgi:Rps23 Pro-64 3,4-dihydroxylase Tpa1-like proline 4-hydroxylase
MSLIQIDANLQVSGQDGSYHNDTYIGGGKDRTIIFYPHIEWKEEWGGELQILDGDLIHNIFPNPGKIVCFDSTVKHRALAPSLNDKPRMSIAFRMIES